MQAELHVDMIHCQLRLPYCSLFCLGLDICNVIRCNALRDCLPYVYSRKP